MSTRSKEGAEKVTQERLVVRAQMQTPKPCECEDCHDWSEAIHMARELLSARARLAALRVAVATYIRSEGCGCCESSKHAEHTGELARLLDVPAYSDGSGYDFYGVLDKEAP